MKSRGLSCLEDDPCPLYQKLSCYGTCNHLFQAHTGGKDKLGLPSVLIGHVIGQNAGYTHSCRGRHRRQNLQTSTKLKSL